MHIDEINKNLRKKLFIYALEEGLIVAFIATIIALIIIWPPENFSLVITFPALIVVLTSFYSRFFYIYSIHKKLVKKYRKTYLPLLNKKLKSNDIKKMLRENWFLNIEDSLESK